jgi:hypothetical protein
MFMAKVLSQQGFVLIVSGRDASVAHRSGQWVMIVFDRRME